MSHLLSWNTADTQDVLYHCHILYLCHFFARILCSRNIGNWGVKSIGVFGEVLIMGWMSDEAVGVEQALPRELIL
jgi:hypothetical protein